MPEADIHTHLQVIQQKLKLLLEKHTVLQKENHVLLSDKEKLLQKLAQKDDEIKELKQQIDVLQSGIQAWHPDQKKVFVKRIDEYLREIDKCLAVLNE